MNNGLNIDLFAGGGGASEGIRRAFARPPDIAINHDRKAIEMHARNHPQTSHLCEDVFSVQPREVCAGRPVDLLWASPDCTHFSKAKGSRPDRPRSRKRRGLAGVVLRWADQVRPACIIVENVEEFLTWCPLDKATGQPDRTKLGASFRRWTSRLRNMGYAIEWRILVAADYGAPTTRKRLFIIARCDGRPIVWPEPTHAKEATDGDLIEQPREKWRSAAECIDWSRPGRSIFHRKKELALNTRKRIATGLRNFVLRKAEPFIVRMGHYSNITGEGDHFRGQSLDLPLGTVTALGNDKGVVVPALAPFVMNNRTDAVGRDARDPMPTITSGGSSKRPSGAAHALSVVTPYLIGIDNQSNPRGEWNASEPLGTITTKNRHAIALAWLEKFHGTSRGASATDPMPTVHGACGGGHLAEVSAFLITYYSTGGPRSVADPMKTLTTKARLGLVNAVISEMNLTDVQFAKAKAVARWMIKYLGKNAEPYIVWCKVSGKSKSFPLATLAIDGALHLFVDILLRMLTPRELALAQGFDAGYWLPDVQSEAVRMIGNSVCPPLAEALVRANMPELALKVAA